MNVENRLFESNHDDYSLELVKQNSRHQLNEPEYDQYHPKVLIVKAEKQKSKHKVNKSQRQIAKDGDVALEDISLEVEQSDLFCSKPKSGSFVSRIIYDY